MTSPPTIGAFRTITGQITSLVVIAVLIGAVLAAGLLMAFSGTSKMGMTPQLKAAAEAARIATIAQEAGDIKAPDRLPPFLKDAQALGEHISLIALPASVHTIDGHPDGDYVQRIRAELTGHWHRQTLDPASVGAAPGAIVVALDRQRGLAFVITGHQAVQTFLVVVAGLALAIIFLVVIALSTYAIHRVTRPLKAFALAAEAFGRDPQRGEWLPVAGPLEIARVATALNEMRDRVQRLVDQRTRMLAAISHDLRTPLTRLQLRSERMPDLQERQAMLTDVAMIEAMLTETLAYLRDGASSEALALIDLPSFLRTICDEYVDVGHRVAYDGPGRLAFSCRPLALKRAIANIVDNGVKFGTEIRVTLSAGPVVEIADNGPGISADLHDKVFEPFFKADEARTGDANGFGLGLAIARDIVIRDGGALTLAANTPRGLIVRMALSG